MTELLIKAIYGDAVDPRDVLAKDIDAADVHIDGPIQVRRKRKLKRVVVVKAMDPDDRHKKLLAAGLLAGTAVEASAAKDAIGPLVHDLSDGGTVRPDFTAAVGARAKARTLKPLLVKPNIDPLVPNHPILPAAAGSGVKAAVQTGNAAIGIGAAKELIDPKQQQQQPVQKGVLLSLRPLNPQAVRRPVTLKAVKPTGSPSVTKSLDADVTISKVDTERRQVFGWASIAVLDGVLVRDRQGDEWPIEELEKSAYDYMLDSRVGGDQHARIVKFDGEARQTSTVIESMVFTPEKIEKMGLPHDFPQGWWIGMQVQDDETWDLIKSGKRTGFSVHGTGKRTPIDKALDLKERAKQAAHPPPVKRKPVKSTALRSLGYQRQTRRMAVEMNSRPGNPYLYKVPPKVAEQMLAAQSKGKAYTQLVRGQRKRDPKVGPVGRARLFAHPDRDVQKSDTQHPNRKARAVELGAQTVAGGVGSAFGAAKLRDEYLKQGDEQKAKFRSATMHTAQRAVRHGVEPAKAARVLHAVRFDHPGFKPLLVAGGAGAVATAAHRYQAIRQFADQRRKQASGLVGKSAFGVEHDIVKTEMRVARTPITQVARVPRVGARHAPAPHVPKHRKLTPLDKVKLGATIHANKLYNALDFTVGALQ